LHVFNVLIGVISVIGVLIFGILAVDAWFYDGKTLSRKLWSQQHGMYLACGRQIIFDLTVIVVLSNMTVAFTMQRGVVFNTALLSVYILIFTIAYAAAPVQLGSHSVLQYHMLQKEFTNPHVMYFAYNRTVCIVIVASGLFGYMSMAGMSYDHCSDFTLTEVLSVKMTPGGRGTRGCLRNFRHSRA
jgi:hypothetical protein